MHKEDAVSGTTEDLNARRKKKGEAAG